MSFCFRAGPEVEVAVAVAHSGVEEEGREPKSRSGSRGGGNSLRPR